MSKYMLPRNSITPSDDVITREIPRKIFVALVTLVYNQTTISMVAVFFCATIILIGLYTPQKDNTLLLAWYGFFLVITLIRILFVIQFKRQPNPDKHIERWGNIFIIGSIFGGMIWGLLGILFFDSATPVQQILMVFMLAGVTAGAVVLSSAIPSAAIAFLLLSVLPFIVAIALIENHTYHLFDAALTVYLIYAITLVIKSYKLIKHSIVLQYENTVLLNNLSKTKDQLEVINKKLEQAATHDSLTQVANRGLFLTNLVAGIRRAQSEHKILALMYIDIDDFKPINDNYGHHTGDLLLLIIIERLKNYFGTGKLLARIGGDELTVILEDVHSISEIATIAQQVCQLIAMPVKTNEVEFRVSASIGVGIYPYDGTTAEALLQNADACMYYVKDHGGNNFHFNRELMMV